MKRDILRFSDVRRLQQSPFFAFVTAILLCGILAGSFTGMHIPRADGSYAEELAGLLASNADGQLPAGRTVVLSLAGSFGWAGGAMLLGACPGRMLWIALLTALRGFLLSFSVAAALVGNGWWGIYLSLFSIGVTALLWIPPFLLLSAAALENGRAGGYWNGWRQYGAILLLSGFLLILCALWRLLAVPAILSLFGA